MVFVHGEVTGPKWISKVTGKWSELLSVTEVRSPKSKLQNLPFHQCRDQLYLVRLSIKRLLLRPYTAFGPVAVFKENSPRTPFTELKVILCSFPIVTLGKNILYRLLVTCVSIPPDSSTLKWRKTSSHRRRKMNILVTAENILDDNTRVEF